MCSASGGENGGLAAWVSGFFSFGFPRSHLLRPTTDTQQFESLYSLRYSAVQKILQLQIEHLQFFSSELFFAVVCFEAELSGRDH